MGDLKKYEIKDFIKFEIGNISLVIGGHNAGRIGLITHQERHPASKTIVTLRDASGKDFSTHKNNVFVLGIGIKPLVSLPSGGGVRLNIIQEQAIRFREEIAHDTILARARARISNK